MKINSDQVKRREEDQSGLTTVTTSKHSNSEDINSVENASVF